MTDKGSGKTRPLIHSPRKLVRVRLFKALQAHKVYELIDVCLALFVNVAGFKSERNVFADCEPWKKIRLLKGKSPVTSGLCDF